MKRADIGIFGQDRVGPRVERGAFVRREGDGHGILPRRGLFNGPRCAIVRRKTSRVKALAEGGRPLE